MDNEIKVGSADWNLLEEMVRRRGAAAVQDAVERIGESDGEE